jgi:predicted TIM-barrel fold metal-dependent hydrolase
MQVSEPIIDPDLAIIDAHHHLWWRSVAFLAAVERDESALARSLASTLRRHARYLADEYVADLNSGHRVIASVYVEVDSMYRAGGPDEMKSVGEIEFANGVAAMGASGLYGYIRPCAGIVGGVDLRLGDAVRDVLLAHIQAGGGRYRGVRPRGVVYDEDPRSLGHFGGAPHVLLDRRFRQGLRHLQPLGLSCDAWQLEYQLPELIDLVRLFCDTQFVVNHLGGLFGIGRHAGLDDDRFDAWRRHLQLLAGFPNVAIKLGGLGMPSCGFAPLATGAATSERLAQQWRPYVETCIDLFGVHRCMFESNFPVDAACTSYPILWNAYKRIVAGASAAEKTALFADTARRLYRLEDQLSGGPT